MADPVRVLSIDGGGIRGIVPALVLAEIERRTARPIAELFELVAGTSTGGILACALTAPGPDGAPGRSAAELVDLYEREGPRIFRRSLAQRVRSVEGLVDEKHDAGQLDAALERYLGEARLGDALCELLVPSYDTAARSPRFFKSRRVREGDEPDVPMRIVARATSSAPTYFEALPLGEESLVDGGVFAINPAMCAFAETLRYHPGAEVRLLSLGTGQLARPYPYEEVKDWGLLEWPRPLLDIVFDGVSDAVDYQLRQALPESRYWRLQTALTDAMDDLDDASEENIRDLRRTAERLIAERSAEIDAICASLTG